MKHLLKPILSIFLFAFCSSIAHSESFTINDLTYTVIDGAPSTVKVRAANTNISGSIEILNTVTNGANTYTVTEIGSFLSCSKIKEITFPSSVSKVETGAFSSCTQLKKVTFLSKVASLGTSVFQDCMNLKTVVLPSELTYLPASIFLRCENLQSITLPQSVTSVASSAFNGCVLLNTIIALPETAPELNSALSGITKSNITLYVPSEAAKTSYATNTYWTGWKEVLVHKIDISDQVDNSSTLTEHNGEIISVALTRTLHTESFNTICLPFALDAEQVTALFGTDCDIEELTSASVSDDALALYFTRRTTMEAGKPYLIQPTTAVNNPFVVNAVINATAGSCDVGDVSLIGINSPTNLPESSNILFLREANTLYLSSGGQLNGLRAYFQLQTQGAKQAASRKISTNLKNTTTSIENVPVTPYAIKRIENGQLIIIRDGVRYTAQGKRLD